MKTHPHSHPPLDAEHQHRFLEFVREVSPEADPASVILFGLMQRTSNLLLQAAERHLDTAGLSWAKMRLLINLHRAERHGPACMQPSELSELQGISRNTVSALIASLEEDGLVSRELHGADRRKFLIRLTPEGRKLLKAKLKGQFEFVTSCFEELSAAERQTLLDQMRRLNRHLLDAG